MAEWQGKISVNLLIPLAFLYGLALLGNYAFVMNLRVQDIMAYLLGIFMLLGLMAGIGFVWLINNLRLSIFLNADSY